MVRPTVKTRRKGPGKRNLKPVAALLVAGALVVLAFPSASRWWWRQAERSDLGDAVASVNEHGCLSCHRTADGTMRWRAFGAMPGSLVGVRAALLEGRPVASGFPGPMSAYGTELSRTKLDRLVLGVGVYADLVASPPDPELEVGWDIAVQMGCFGCHGPLGAGGTVNLGSARGSVPGFLGAAFRATMVAPGGLAGVIRDGRVAGAAWWAPWQRPALAMPAYGDRLDSTELELLVRYLEWLADHGVTIRESDSYHEAGGSG